MECNVFSMSLNTLINTLIENRWERGSTVSTTVKWKLHNIADGFCSFKSVVKKEKGNK